MGLGYNEHAKYQKRGNCMTVFVIETDNEILACFEVMKYLRLHLEQEFFVERVRQQYQQGYRLACIRENEQVVALMGYRFMDRLSWGKILYIDDLITHPNFQKQGYGTELLQWAEEIAREHHCQEIHLDSGYQRYAAHRLYLNKGFELSCHHLAKTVN